MLAPAPTRTEIELLCRMGSAPGDVVFVPRKFVRAMRHRGFILTDGLSGQSDWAVLMTFVGVPENARSNRTRASEGRQSRKRWAFADRKLAEASSCA